MGFLSLINSSQSKGNIIVGGFLFIGFATMSNLDLSSFGNGNLFLPGYVAFTYSL